MTYMDNDIKQKAIELVASLFANWKACSVEHDDFEANRYHEKYDGARCMAKLMGITESEIESCAWRVYGDEIRKIYESNNATW